ncbi:MAG: GNAT family N-acetyltransferase [Jiangellaceae bacterium]
MRIRAFSVDDVEDCGRLLAARHRRDRSAEPALAERYESPEVCARLIRDSLDQRAEGAVALDRDHLVGYQLAIPGDDLRGRHVWSGLEHHATAPDSGPEIARHLYANLAAGWVSDRRLHHYALVPVADVDRWLALAFGHEQVHAMGSTNVPETLQAHGNSRSDFSVRQAGPDDLDAVQPVSRLIADSNVASPVFAYVDQSFYDDLRPSLRETLEDETVTVWIAEDATEVLGFVAVRPIPADEGTMLKPAGTVELIVAATLPTARGRGVGRTLCERALAESATQGLEICVVDWRAANLTASVFWPRRGFRPTAYRLHRLIDPRVVSGAAAGD